MLLLMFAKFIVYSENEMNNQKLKHKLPKFLF